ncbi:MAG: DUF58 domain-containing protein [Clostridiales bacterium]|nr:DUF58 domain-containing protein [Clostridiales bacterium]
MLKTWCIYLIALISAIAFFLCYKMWVSWYCLIAVLLVPLISLIAGIVAAAGLKFETCSPSSSLIGDENHIEVKVSGFASYFSFCRVRIKVTDHMADLTRRENYRIHDSGTLEIPVDTSHCGAYRYEFIKVRIYDLLGFFFISRRINRAYEILVKPRPEMPDIMPNTYGFKAKNLRKARQPVSEIYDIRDYQPGDPVKSIHWKMSAKKDKLLVKDPFEQYGGHSRLMLKMTPDRDIMDLHLGQILFTSKYLLDHEVPHRIRIIPPDSREISYEVESVMDLDKAMFSILRMKIPKEDPVHEE